MNEFDAPDLGRKSFSLISRVDQINFIKVPTYGGCKLDLNSK
jgi:hypothetical protein